MAWDWHEVARLRPPEGAETAVQQHPVYGAACAALGTRWTGLELRAGGRRLASALVLQRRWPLLGRCALVGRGPAWHPELDAEARRAALRQLVDGLARNHRAVLLTPDRIGPADPLDGAGLLRMVTAGHVARLEIAADAALQRARLRGKWRNRLVRAEAAALELRAGPLPPDPGHWLLRAEAAQARARRYARLPPEFAAAWARAGETRLFSAWAGGRPVAGMLFLRHGATASYHVGWAAPEGRTAQAHAALMWQATLWARAAGLAALELGGLDTERAPGLARFKLGTGAEAVALGATWLRAPLTAPFARAAARAGARRSAAPPAPAGAAPG